MGVVEGGHTCHIFCHNNFKKRCNFPLSFTKLILSSYLFVYNSSCYISALCMIFHFPFAFMLIRLFLLDFV